MSSKQKYYISIQRLAKRARIALRPFVVSIVLIALLILTPGSKTFAQVEFDRLMKAVPFDQLQIKVDNQIQILQIELLDTPNRRKPELLKRGVLEIRLLESPDEVYTVKWIDVENIIMWEEKLLSEVHALIDKGDFDNAFDYFLFFKRRYDGMPGVAQALYKYQFMQAGVWAAEGKERDLEALSLLESLYRDNPDFVSATGQPVIDEINVVLKRVLDDYISQDKMVLVRKLSTRMIRSIGRDNLPSVVDAENRLIQQATAFKNQAQQAMENNQLREAQQLSRQMMKVYPRLEGGRELAIEIARRYPVVLVGVTQKPTQPDRSRMDSWPDRRTGYLLRRTFMEFDGPGADRGKYSTPLGTVRQTGDKRGLIITIDPANLKDPDSIDGYLISRRLLNMADVTHQDYVPQWASLFSRVDVRGVYEVIVHFRRPHVLPEALLQSFFDHNVNSDLADGYFRVDATKSDDMRTRYVVNPDSPFVMNVEDPNFIPPSEIVEIQYEDFKEVVKGLRKGEVDVVDRITPAQAMKLQAELGSDIKVAPYAMPTMHMLIPNYEKPYMQSEMFRRAVLYAIRRNVILDELLLENYAVPGCTLVSGPFAPGVDSDDPLSYAYDTTITPRTYSPRLALVLVKLAERKMKEAAKLKMEEAPPIPTLIIAHPATEMARKACQVIKFQLDQVALKTELLELAPGQTVDESGEAHLTYAEVAMWEPIVDGKKLLSPNGLVKITDDHVNRSMRWVDTAMRWPEVRSRIRQVHRIANEKVAIIPLWQIREYYAHIDSIKLGSNAPVSLYHGISRWRLVPTFDED